MADLASSQVSLQPTSLSEAEFWLTKRRGLFMRRVKLTNVTVGGAANRITAAALGFKKLVSCDSLFDSTNNKIIPATVDPVNNVVLLGAGTTLAVGDVTGVTGYLNVAGY
jgi:hypothetical protein